LLQRIDFFRSGLPLGTLFVLFADFLPGFGELPAWALAETDG
jgi:hypothetical protein